MHLNGLKVTWGTAAVLVCAGVSGGGVEEKVNDEEEEEEVNDEDEDNTASVELGVVVEATKLLTATLEVAVEVTPVAVPDNSISQAEIPSTDCPARLASHWVPLLRRVWQ